MMRIPEDAFTGSYKTILWHRLKELFLGDTIRIHPAPRATESITVRGYTELEMLAFKRALIRAGCPHIRISAQWSQGLMSATIPTPTDPERLDLCLMKAGLILEAKEEVRT